MRIAIIADIHGNLPALQAVLKDVEEAGVEQVWNLGDNVGYGPYPNEVVEQLQQIGAINVLGNYDKKAFTMQDRPKSWRARKDPIKLRLLELAAEQTSPEYQQWSLRQPEIITQQMDQRWVLMTHCSPRSQKQAITPQTPNAELKAISTGIEAALIVMGHSHQTMWRQLAGISWANPGSVGRQHDGDPRARYALLDMGPKSLRFYPKIVEYDIDALCKRCKELGYPKPVLQVFTLGRGLEWIV